MRKQPIFAIALLASGLGWSSLSAQAQQSSDPLPPAPTPAPSASSAKADPKTDPKTDPKANPKADKDKSKTPSPATEPAAPDSSQTSAKKPSTADDNPFPEDVSKQAAAAAKDAASTTSTPNAPSSSNPAAGVKSPNDSSSLDNTDKLGLDDPARKQLKLESPDGSAGVYDPKRATEDVRVGKFYMQTGYLKGAYARFKDATVFDHENVEAVFWLAEAARKLNLEQEAQQNYQLYLAAVPDGPSAKAARKALGELGLSSKP